MRRRVQTFVLIWATAMVVWVQTVSAQSSVPVAEQELRAVEEQRREAIKRGDFAALNRIYADEFTGIAGNGQVINKEQLMAVFKRNDPRVVFMTDEIRVRVFGEVAVFTGRLIGRTAGGEMISATRFTHIFVKREGRWQCVSGQATAISAS